MSDPTAPLNAVIDEVEGTLPDVSEAAGPGESDSSRERGQSQFRLAWARFGGNKIAVVGLGFIAVLIIAAILAPLIAGHDPLTVDVDNALVPPGHGHLLGTDYLGRDLFSRLIYGLRTALMVGFGAELAALLVAIIIGLAAGYAGGRAEQLLMGFTDVMYAFPAYLFSVILVTVMGRSLGAVILAIGVAAWVTQARLIRAQTISLKERDYIEAARAMGASGPRIALRYILPNAIGPILVTTSFGIPGAIAAEAGLSLLGLGVQPPAPTWGTMLREGAQYLMVAPYMMLPPATLFALTMLVFNWVGDGVREAFDTAGESR